MTPTRRALLLAAVVVGVGLGGCGSPTADATTKARARLDARSAAEVAVAVVERSQRWMYLSADALRADIDTLAADDHAPGLHDTIAAEVARARDGLSGAAGEVWWSVRPLALRQATISPRAAAVEVWAVAVLAAPGAAAPQSFWHTYRVELAWDRGWRLADLRATPGPTPQLAPADEAWIAVEFSRALDGFERLGPR